MRNKYKIFDKSAISLFVKIISAFASVVTFILTFYEFDECIKIGIFIFFIIASLLIYLLVWTALKNRKSITLKMNNSTVKILFGDLFNESCNKVIGFNEYFDTIVDDELITKPSLNGQYITKYINDINALNTVIENDSRVQENFVEENNNKQKGNKKKYQLGTICKNNKFFLLALTKFNEKNEAYLYLNDYALCMLKMWNELNSRYNSEPIALPLLGAGITRMLDYSDISEQELLEIMVWTLKISKVKFTYPSEIRIILRNDLRDEVNLNKLKEII